MKGTLACEFFGHKFMQVIYDKGRKSVETASYEPVPYCVRCGLTKKELRKL